MANEKTGLLAGAGGTAAGPRSRNRRYVDEIHSGLDEADPLLPADPARKPSRRGYTLESAAGSGVASGATAAGHGGGAGWRSRSQLALDAVNLLIADVQGLGALAYIYCITSAARGGLGMSPTIAGTIMTVQGLIPTAVAPFLGHAMDSSTRKRTWIFVGLVVTSTTYFLLAATKSIPLVGTILMVQGGIGALYGPALNSISLGIVGQRGLPARSWYYRVTSRNARRYVTSHGSTKIYGKWYGLFFFVVGCMAFVAITAVLGIRPRDIDCEVARSAPPGAGVEATPIKEVLQRVDVSLFCVAVTLFHFANAAMLPQVGAKLELLNSDNSTARELVVLGRHLPIDGKNGVSFATLVAQVIMIPIGYLSGWLATKRWAGAKAGLVVAFVTLPIRGVGFALSNSVWGLLGLQFLDGIGAGAFGIMAMLIMADLTAGTGRFSMMQGYMGTATGIGAALSNGIAGVLVEAVGFNVMFLILSAISLVAVAVLLMVNTKRRRVDAKKGYSKLMTTDWVESDSDGDDELDDGMIANPAFAHDVAVTNAPPSPVQKADAVAAAQCADEDLVAAQAPPYTPIDDTTITDTAANKDTAESNGAEKATTVEDAAVAKIASDRAADKTAIDKAVVEKVAAEKALPCTPIDDTTITDTAAKKATAESNGAEKATTVEDAAVAKIASDRAADKAAIDKAVVEKVAAEEFTAEKNFDRKAVPEQLAVEKPPTEEVILKTSTVSKLTSEEIAAAKATEEKAKAKADRARAKAEAEYLAAEKARAERARVKEEKAAAETARLEKAEREKAIAAKARAEKANKALAERRVREEKAMAEHLARAEKARVGKAEAERINRAKLAAEEAALRKPAVSPSKREEKAMTEHLARAERARAEKAEADRVKAEMASIALEQGGAAVASNQDDEPLRPPGVQLSPKGDVIRAAATVGAGDLENLAGDLETLVQSGANRKARSNTIHTAVLFSDHNQASPETEATGRPRSNSIDGTRDTQSLTNRKQWGSVEPVKRLSWMPASNSRLSDRAAGLVVRSKGSSDSTGPAKIDSGSDADQTSVREGALTGTEQVNADELQVNTRVLADMVGASIDQSTAMDGS